MTEEIKAFFELVKSAYDTGALKKLIFSRPRTSEVRKITARLTKTKRGVVLSLEYNLPSGTVSQKNLYGEELKDVIPGLIEDYAQVNLLTTLGDAERKVSSAGKVVVLGVDKLRKRLSGAPADFEAAIEAIDKKKNYILSGNEPFLIKLGISDKGGRIHDKKQGKYRQINRFLEYVDGIYQSLPKEGDLTVFDLCCGKSYLSFAVYYFLTEIKGRRVRMLGIDLKRDVIEWCDNLARELGFGGMRFIADDIKNAPRDTVPDMVISLHACDIATDIVLSAAQDLGAKVILSTPCCHRYVKNRINSPALGFVTRHGHISGKLCEALTDSLRILRLESLGYSADATELTDPDDTPKNTLIRAIRRNVSKRVMDEKRAEYEAALKLLFGEKSDEYLKEIK